MYLELIRHRLKVQNPKQYSLAKISLLLGLFLLLLITRAGKLDAQQLKPSNGGKEENNAKAFYYEGVVECSGRLMPARRFILHLKPGERIVRSMTRTGMLVDKDAPLVQLANDRLIDRLIRLYEKELELQTEKDTLTILDVKIAVAEKAIRRLEKQIKEERKLGEDLPDYLVEGKLKEWIEVKEQREEDLIILRKEKTMLGVRHKKRANLSTIYSGNISDVKDQIERLLVKAPFKGRVVKMSPSLERTAAGEMVLEIWDETNLQVEAEAWQHQIQYIIPGYEAKIFPNFYNNFFVHGTVHSIGAADISSHGKKGFPVFPVKIDLNENPPDLVSGMSVTVKIYDRDKKETAEQ